jgi:hypothetical protein
LNLYLGAEVCEIICRMRHRRNKRKAQHIR